HDEGSIPFARSTPSIQGFPRTSTDRFKPLKRNNFFFWLDPVTSTEIHSKPRLFSPLFSPSLGRRGVRIVAGGAD
ncbi:hypothetical protein, partial [Pseudomonas aeruginosa]